MNNTARIGDKVFYRDNSPPHPVVSKYNRIITDKFDFFYNKTIGYQFYHPVAQEFYKLYKIQKKVNLKKYSNCKIIDNIASIEVISIPTYNKVDIFVINKDFYILQECNNLGEFSQGHECGTQYFKITTPFIQLKTKTWIFIGEK
jgi:hypothetical protein